MRWIILIVSLLTPMSGWTFQVIGPMVLPTSDCMSGIYTMAWTGEHSFGTKYACDWSGNPLTGTVTGLPTISTAVGEGDADVALSADANNEYVTWSDSGGEKVDLNGTQTVWMRVYISDTPTGDTRLFNAEYDSTNSVNIVVKTDRSVVGSHRIGATLGSVYAPSPISSGSWVDIAYSWDLPSQRHTVNTNGSWRADEVELASSAGTDVSALRIGTYSGFSMAASGNVRVSKVAVVNGYKTSKPW